MIKKFQTPAGKLELPKKEILEIEDNVPVIVEDYEYPDYTIHTPKWDMQDYANNMNDIRNELNKQGITSIGQSFKPSQSGKINPGVFLANWNSHRGDLTFENMVQTRQPYTFPTKQEANKSIVDSTTKAINWSPNSNYDHTQQLGEAVENQGITPAVKALAKQFGISENEALNKYKGIMQFRYNARVNPAKRDFSQESINSTIDAYDAQGVFDGMTDAQKKFIFNDLAYNGNNNDETAFAKKGKKLIPKRKKGKLC